MTKLYETKSVYFIQGCYSMMFPLAREVGASSKGLGDTVPHSFRQFPAHINQK